MRSKSRRHSLANDSADIKAFRMLLPYLWEYRGRLVLALFFLIFTKLANVSVPLVLKQIVDGLNQPKASLIVPAFLLIGYGLLRSQRRRLCARHLERAQDVRVTEPIAAVG